MANRDQREERQRLGDYFDKRSRSLNGLPDVTKTAPSTKRVLTPVLEYTQTFIVQTYRQRDHGDEIFVEYIGKEGSLRLVLPPPVADLIARQRDALTTKVRRKIAKAKAEERRASRLGARAS